MLIVRQLAMTVITLCRVTLILFHLGTNKVRQLAISTVILSSVINFTSARLK